MKDKVLVTEKVIDSNLVDAATRRAAKYVHDRKPQGLGVDDVRDFILVEFCRRSKEINVAARKGDSGALSDILENATNVALGRASNESHKHIRKLVPFQVRNVSAYLEDKAYEDIACDMADYFFRQSRRETESWFVRCAIRHLDLPDRLIAAAYMELGSWKRVAGRFGLSEGHFRRRVLPGFIARFKAEWRKCW